MSKVRIDLNDTIWIIVDCFVVFQIIVKALGYHRFNLKKIVAYKIIKSSETLLFCERNTPNHLDPQSNASVHKLTGPTAMVKTSIVLFLTC